jgi:hypothetical protein
MPTDEYLKQGDWSEVVAFHPLSENILRGESDVIHSLRSIVEFRTRAVFTTLLVELMQIAVNEDYHKNLKTKKQTALLTAVPKANDKTLKALNKLVRRNFEGFLKIYLKRDGLWHNKEYRRVAVVHSPIYEELLHSEGTHIGGVDLGSKAARNAIAELIGFILPDLDDIDTYSFGSAANVAPYFHSLMGAYGQVAKRLNDVVHTFKAHLSEPTAMDTDLTFMEDLDRIDQWKEIIPAQDGNKGAVAKGEAEESLSHTMAQQVNQASHVPGTEVGAPQPAPAPAAPQPAPAAPPAAAQPAPVPQPTQAPVPPAAAQSGGSKSEGAVDWKSMRPQPAGGAGYPPAQYGYGGPAPMGGGYGYGYGQPQGQFAQMVPAQPPPGPWGGGFGGYGSNL